MGTWGPSGPYTMDIVWHPSYPGESPYGPKDGPQNGWIGQPPQAGPPVISGRQATRPVRPTGAATAKIGSTPPANGGRAFVAQPKTTGRGSTQQPAGGGIGLPGGGSGGGSAGNWWDDILGQLNGAINPGGSGSTGGGTAGGTTPGTGTTTPTTPGTSTVTTSITPEPIYNPNQTQIAINQLRARAAQSAAMPYALKPYDRPGVSRSAGNYAAAMPKLSEAYNTMNAAGSTVSFADALANAQHVLAGQQARDQEGLGLAGTNASLAALQQQYQQQGSSNAMQFVLSLLRGLGNSTGGLMGGLI